MKLAILAAIPHELRKIIKNLKATRDARRCKFDIYHATHGSTEMILATTGIGTANAESALRYVNDEFRPDMVLSIGYGGALYEKAAIGDLIWGSRFILMPELRKDGTCKASERETLEISGNEKIFNRLLDKISIRKGDIVTIRSLRKKSEMKKVLSGDLLNPVCDMETFPLAHFCLETGLSFAAIRSVTDLQDEDIPPELQGISDESGKYSLLRTVITLVSKPKVLPIVIRLARNSQKASQNLCCLVDSFLETLL